jgi:mannose-6-phosphate isomerase-like protein (cupin superfamily)
VAGDPTIPAPYALPAGDGERIAMRGNTITLKATAASTGGVLMLSEVEAMPGGGPPLHVHDSEDEWFYVLEGTFDIVLGDRVVRAGPGDFAFVPHGTPHRFANAGSGPARIIAAVSPGGLEDFFRAAGGDHRSEEMFESAGGDHGVRVVDWRDAGQPAAED